MYSSPLLKKFSFNLSWLVILSVCFFVGEGKQGEKKTRSAFYDAFFSWCRFGFSDDGDKRDDSFFRLKKKKLVFFLRRIHFLLVNIMAWRATTVQDGSDARRMFFQLSGIRRFIILVIASGDLILWVSPKNCTATLVSLPVWHCKGLALQNHSPKTGFQRHIVFRVGFEWSNTPIQFFSSSSWRWNLLCFPASWMTSVATRHLSLLRWFSESALQRCQLARLNIAALRRA